MFENLGNRLQDAVHKIKGYGKITEDNISDIIKEVRIALLEADVNYKVVKEFVANVNEQALGTEVNSGLKTGEVLYTTESMKAKFSDQYSRIGEGITDTVKVAVKK